MLRLNPISDRVVVRPKNAEEKKNGIVIPPSARERSLVGEVLAVGPGRSEERPVMLKVGMQVLLARNSGIEIKLNGEDLLVLREDEILGVIDER